MQARLDEEIRKAIAKCIVPGQLLWLSDQAREVAERTGADLRAAEVALLEAAIAARVHVRFGPAIAASPGPAIVG